MKRALKKVLTIEARRKDLIEGTLRSIQKYGYQNSTIQTICEESGLSRGLVSHYFEGKEDLLLAAFQYLNAQLDAEARQAVRAAGSDPFRRLLAAGLVTFARDRPYHEVTLHFWSITLSNPKAQMHHRELWGRFRSAIERLMGKAAESRDISLDTRHCAIALSQLIDGLWLGWVLEDAYDIHTCRKLIRDWLCGLFDEDPADFPILVEETSGEQIV